MDQKKADSQLHSCWGSNPHFLPHCLAPGHFIHTLAPAASYNTGIGDYSAAWEQGSLLVNLILLKACSEFMPQVAVRWNEPVPSASDGYKKDMQSDVHLSKYITKLNDFSFTKLIKNGTKQ